MSRPLDFIDAFAATVNRRADHTAMESDDGFFTYAELDRASNQLAHRLHALGVGPDSRVGVSLPRGGGELVALLAIAKAGAAHVPLVPSHPIERLRMIMTDASPEVMIVHSQSPLHDGAGERVILLDDIAAATADQPCTPLPLRYEPEHLAYVMFTSGSTGRPKGVEVTRGALANFMRSMAHTPGLGPDERLLAITTTAFDIAGLELFLPLFVGATVVVAELDTTDGILGCCADVSSAATSRRCRRLRRRGACCSKPAGPATAS